MSSTEERSVDDVTPQTGESRVRSDKVVLLLVLQTCQRSDIAQGSDRDAVSKDCCDSRGPDITKIPLDTMVLIVRVVEQGLLLGCHAGSISRYSSCENGEEQWSVV